MTHRLASSKTADRIIVLKDGHTIQDGTIYERKSTEDILIKFTILIKINKRKIESL